MNIKGVFNMTFLMAWVEFLSFNSNSNV